MKTRLIATAIATAIAGQAHALTTYYISSNVTGAEFWSDNFYIIPSPGSSPSSLAFGGTALDADDSGTIDSSNVTLTGETQFYLLPGPPPPVIARAIFNLNSGSYVPSSGVTFTAGTVEIDILTASGWTPYSTIDAAVTNVPFLVAQPALWNAPYITAGLLLVPGTTSLPGLYVPPATGLNNSLGGLYMPSAVPTGLFMKGTITLTP